MNTALQTPVQPLNWMALTVQTEKAAQRLRAFNHNLRHQILVRLDSAGPQSVGELQQHFSLEQSVASQHLAILRKAGLVTTRRDGKSIYYSLNREALHNLFQGCIALNNNNA